MKTFHNIESRKSENGYRIGYSPTIGAVMIYGQSGSYSLVVGQTSIALDLGIAWHFVRGNMPDLATVSAVLETVAVENRYGRNEVVSI